jgi:SAM-dependent methyltransferase
MIFASIDLDKAHLKEFMDSLQKIKESKFDGVEICLWEDMNLYVDLIKKALIELGLQSNVHNDLMREERGIEDCKLRLLYSLKFKKKISALNFISHPIKPYTNYLKETKELFNLTNEDILVENVKGITLPQIDFLGRPIVLDIGNLIKNGEYPKLEEYKDIKWLHIHDYRDGLDHLPLGKGIVDLMFFINKFQKTNCTIELGSVFREWKNLGQDYRNSIDFINNVYISQSSYGKNVRLAHLLRNIGKENFNLVVDFGCGEGYLLHNIYAKNKLGYDLHPNKVFNDINYFNQDIESTNLKDVDLIVCSEVIEHIEKDILAIKKIYDSLRKGGKIFLTTINKNIRKDKSKQDKERLHLRRYGTELKEIMEAQGFRTISFYQIRSKHYYLHKGNFKNYNIEEDISQGNEESSGWVYYGEKEDRV